MRACEIIAFILFAASAAVAAHTRQWPLVGIAAGLAAITAPAAFELN